MSKKKNVEGFDELIYEEVLKARNLSRKPKMLLHACCAVCLSHVLNLIAKEFDITVYYYNPNIHPESEYMHRLEEVKKIIKCLELDIKVIEGTYDTENYFIQCREYANEKEGGLRCIPCFKLRLEGAARYAKDNGFDMFATTLTISPHKDSTIINELGESIGEEIEIHFAKSNFKKREGFKKAGELCDKYNIYRQNYCGCVYSIQEKEE